MGSSGFGKTIVVTRPGPCRRCPFYPRFVAESTCSRVTNAKRSDVTRVNRRLLIGPASGGKRPRHAVQAGTIIPLGRKQSGALTHAVIRYHRMKPSEHVPVLASSSAKHAIVSLAYPDNPSSLCDNGSMTSRDRPIASCTTVQSHPLLSIFLAGGYPLSVTTRGC